MSVANNRDEDIKNIKNEVNQLNSSKTKLTETIHQLSLKLSDIQTQLRNNENTRNELQSKVSTLASQFYSPSTNSSKKSSINQQLNAAREQLRELDRKREELRFNDTQIQSQITTESNKLTTINANINRCNSILSRMNAYPNLSAAEVQDVINLEDQLRNIQSRVYNLDAEYQKIINDVATSNSQIAAYNATIKDLKAKKAKATSQKEKEKYESQIKKYQDKIASEKNKIKQYDQNAKNLKANIESMKEEYNVIAKKLENAYGQKVNPFDGGSLLDGTPDWGDSTKIGDKNKGKTSTKNLEDRNGMYDNSTAIDNMGTKYVEVKSTKNSSNGTGGAKTKTLKATGPTVKPEKVLNNNANNNDSAVIYHPNNLFLEEDTDLFHERYRYGILNAYMGLNNTREYLFFTKPDLNILPPDDSTGIITPTLRSNSKGGGISPKDYLNGVLQSYPFWSELCLRYPGVIECLQAGVKIGGRNDPFNHLLENMVQSTIDIPSLSAEMTETPSNMYGVNYNYRGSSEASDDGFDFSLEFKDTKYLHVYNFFKAYEEYETLKHHGIIGPWKKYIERKILHDQYCIFKFVVGEDGETLVYYAKYYGVKSKSLPRDVFNSNSFDNGLSYSVDFNAAFVEDMNPMILADFNALSYNYWKSQPQFIDVHDFKYDQRDNRPATAALIVREANGKAGYQIVGGTGEYFADNITSDPKKLTKHPGGYCYKIKWKGDKTV